MVAEGLGLGHLAERLGGLLIRYGVLRSKQGVVHYWQRFLVRLWLEQLGHKRWSLSRKHRQVRPHCHGCFCEPPAEGLGLKQAAADQELDIIWPLLHALPHVIEVFILQAQSILLAPLERLRMCLLAEHGHELAVPLLLARISDIRLDTRRQVLTGRHDEA